MLNQFLNFFVLLGHVKNCFEIHLKENPALWQKLKSLFFIRTVTGILNKIPQIISKAPQIALDYFN